MNCFIRNNNNTTNKLFLKLTLSQYNIKQKLHVIQALW